MRATLLCLVIFGLLAGTPAVADDPPLPPLTGRIVDQANILSDSEEKLLTQKLADAERTSGTQIVIATLPRLGSYSIETWGLALGNGWRIGHAGKDDGIIILVAPNDREMRIDVGAGLEKQVTNREAASIIERLIIPAFRGGNYALGFSDAITALTDEVTGKGWGGFTSGTFSSLVAVVAILFLIACVIALIIVAFKSMSMPAPTVSQPAQMPNRTGFSEAAATVELAWQRRRKEQLAREDAVDDTSSVFGSPNQTWWGASSSGGSGFNFGSSHSSSSGSSFGSSSSSSHSSSSGSSFSGGGGSFRGGGATGKW